MAQITSSNWQNYVDRKIATHGKNMYAQDGSPSVQAGYGTFDSTKTAHKTLCGIYSQIPFANITENTACTGIPRGFTVAVEDDTNHTVVEYQYKKEMPNDGYTYADLDHKIDSTAIEIIDDLTHTNTNKALSANQGKVLKGLVDANKNSLSSLKAEVAALGTNTDVPVVIPSSAVELPTSSTLEYDADTTYIITLNNTDIATVHYPYEHTDNGTVKGYLVFKAIDRDLYYVYVHTTGNYYSPVEQVTYNNLSHSEAQAIFKAGQYAVKQIIDVNGKNGDAGTPSPKGYWEHGVPSVFATFHGYPLRYNQIYEAAIDINDNGYHVLLKCDETNTIFKYRAYTSEPSPNTNNVKTGCWYLASSYTTADAAYTTYDKFFDTGNAVNINYGSTNVKAALDELYGNYVVVTSNLPTMTDSVSIPTPTKNTYYDYGSTALTVVNVSGIPVANTKEVVIRFLTDSSATCTLILSDATGEIQRIVGSTSLAKGKVYVLSVLRGVICICEAPAYEAPATT